MPQITFRCSQELCRALNRFVSESNDYSRTQILQSLLILYLKKPKFYPKTESPLLKGPQTETLIADLPPALIEDLQNQASAFQCNASHIMRMAVYQGVILHEL